MINQKPRRPKIIFFGNECIATGVSTKTPVLKSLCDHGFEVSLVIASTGKVTSRHQTESPIAQSARQLNIPLISPNHIAETTDKLKSIKPSIGILVAYGQIIPESIIKLFPRGIINLHPSLLPQYRGSTPIEQAILDGQKETGVTIMKLASKMDAGPILAQEKVAIDGKSKQELADTLLSQGGSLILDLLPRILSGSVDSRAQDENEATYTRLITKVDGKLDSTKKASQLNREIIAYQGWPGSYFEYQGINITLLETIESGQLVTPGKLIKVGQKLYFGCQNGSLEIVRLRPAGKTAITARDFINSHQDLAT